ncbi:MULTISPECIES: hypothetical protein [Bacteroidales]|uniref:hypothetical protein n=1 Tax=Bacteroidales TaxID=171549 RepID=UPI00266F00EE|nr:MULTISPECIES: hypothetical protein [Bacteroidales]
MISKFSLYDLFAMIIPGSIIMVSTWIRLGIDLPFYVKELNCGCKIIIDNDYPMWLWVVLLAVAYFIGLINNWVADGIFRFFRNDQSMINNEMLRVAELNGVVHLDKFGGNKYVNSKESLHRLPYAIIRSLINAFRGLFPCNKRQAKNSENYYKVYYALNRQKLLGSIPIVEAQVALIRNCILPLLFLTSILGYRQFWCCVIPLFMLTVFLFIVMVQRQNKIYQMVWEASNYYEL